MRELHSHKVSPTDDTLTVTAHDDAGPGGASHSYSIRLPDGQRVTLQFQKGAIGDVGPNGITNEALVTVLEDRLAGFLKGPFADEYSQLALAHIRVAQTALRARTAERMARGVESMTQP